MTLIKQHNLKISKLCKNHKVKSLYAFGSVLTDNFTTESDIDLIVDFEPLDVLEYADNYFDLKFALQELLKRSIHLLEEQAIRNPFFRSAINQQRQLIYEQWDQIMAVWYLKCYKWNETFFIDIPKEFVHYQTDVRTRRAVERNIEIIGEAMNRILKQPDSPNISNSRKLVDVRNRIIHGYDSVSDEVIWGIVIKHLPLLQEEVAKLLEE